MIIIESSEVTKELTDFLESFVLSVMFLILQHCYICYIYIIKGEADKLELVQGFYETDVGGDFNKSKYSL